MKIFQGIGVSPGIAIGNVSVIKSRFNLSYQGKIQAKNLPHEIEKFKGALNLAEKEILATQKNITKTLGEKYGEIFAMHLLLLKDKVLQEETIKSIKNDGFVAEYAFQRVLNKILENLGKKGDTLFEDERKDLFDVAEKVFSYLNREKSRSFIIKEKAIIAAHDLSPSQTAAFNPELTIGFVTEIGSATSHTAIMAKALEIPAVVGVDDITKQLEDEQTVILDGFNGELIVEPTSALLGKYKEKQKEYLKKRKNLYMTKGLVSKTTDGKRISLMANIELPEEIHTLVKYGAEGIGLYRTEYLFLNRRNMPSEEEQFHSYKKVLLLLRDKPMVIRTLDIGGDKFISELRTPTELNPFLGNRAIRFCLSQIEFFKTQLKAMMRAGYYGDLRILIPMISIFEEIKKTKELIKECASELKKDGKKFRELPLGIMIEVPSAALISDILAKEVDFFSFGTNDLIQYTIAVDRVNEKISYLYQPFHPAILKLIKISVDNAKKCGIKTSICGEAASIPEIACVLLGLGVDELSMSPSAIPDVKQLLRKTSFKKMTEIAGKVFEFSTHEEIHNYVKKTLNERGKK
ncbi:MAG: phosphoenolpyruvate--protein phosphotransferase [Candidatus Omnitrophica bacterium]|nr:phosphoenolpyruvate--protein phosphotransferase [Candidatus Omnitrophota bacterium]